MLCNAIKIVSAVTKKKRGDDGKYDDDDDEILFSNEAKSESGRALPKLTQDDEPSERSERAANERTERKDDDAYTKRSLQWGRQSDGMKRKAFNSDDQRLSALIKHSAARSTAATLKLGSKRGYAWDIGPRLNS